MSALTSEGKTAILKIGRCGLRKLRATSTVERIIMAHKKPSQGVGQFMTVETLKSILHGLIEAERWQELKDTVVALLGDEQQAIGRAIRQVEQVENNRRPYTRLDTRRVA